MKIVIPAYLLFALIVCTAHADIIYFRDGMKTICQEKAWEVGDEIKCEYGGWVISYPKNEVLRVLKTIPEKQPDTSGNTLPVVQKPNKAAEEKIAAPRQGNGIAFYDPRRPFKYWTSATSKHKNFKEAIQSLAETYNRSPEWIQAHMGDSNDLEQIHRNLAEPSQEIDVAVTQAPASQATAILFYNPRRANPYQTGATSQHKTFQEAIDALAKQYRRPAEWIKEHMGTTNDINEIHANLSAQETAESSQ